jgi:hypothetical protein
MEIRAEDRSELSTMFFWTSFALLYVALIVMLFFHSAQVLAAQRSDDLGFFKIVDDRSIYERQREEFAVLKFKDARGFYERYVARRPSHEIPLESIRSITITKQKVYGSASTSEEMAKDALGLKSKNQASKETYPYGYVYKASFQLAEKGVKSFNSFANASDGKGFDLRLGKNRLGTVQFIGPFDSNEFAGFLESRNLEELKAIFSPAKDRTKWE